MLDYTDHRATERRVWVLFHDPAHRSSLQELRTADKFAADDIARLRQLIADLEQYRRDMADRAAYLISTPAEPCATLTRQPATVRRGVQYAFRAFVRYPDGTERETGRTIYTGKQRAKALADFSEYQRTHTGTTCTLDIRRAGWEK